MTGLIIVGIGIILLVLGASITRAKVKGKFGSVNPGSMQLSQGTGVVPSWVSLLVLLGWLVVAVGIVWTIVELIA